MLLDLDFICDSVKAVRPREREGLIITGVETDSRRMTPGRLFFALPGEHFDGHTFVEKAFQKGASAAVVRHSYKNQLNRAVDKPLIFVDDTLLALQDLARAYRTGFKIPVVAVTGSVGKTTSKDMLALCLQTRFKTLKTEGNYNNEIGVPLSVLRLEEGHQAAVFELAMRAPGEIRRLAEIAGPNCALVTNVEAVHLETMGNLDNIARAKAEVLSGLKADNFAVLNGDNEILLNAARPYACKKYSFGYNPNCDFLIKKVKVKNQGIEIAVKMLDQHEELWLPLPSPKFAANAVASAAVASLLGVGIDSIKEALLTFEPGSNRLNIINLPAGVTVINDTYNANPLSMTAALETGRQLAGENRLVAVLGDMFELGNYEMAGHLEVGKQAVENRVDMLITIGERAEFIARGALQAGMNQEKTACFQSKSEGTAFLIKNLGRSDTVLFKASRGMQLETMVAELISQISGKL